MKIRPTFLGSMCNGAIFSAVVSIIAGSLACALAGTAHAADSYPSKPIRIFTSEPGVGTDLLSRVIASEITKPLGQPVIVENRAGILPEQTVARAAPDGYSLLLYGPAVWLLPFLQDDVPWDPVKDFTPITWVGSSPNLLVVNPTLPTNSYAEFIAMARSKPGTLNYASGPAGTASHLAAELFKSMAGINLTRVPYKSANAALNDVLSGQVPVMLTTAGTLMPHVRAGKLRTLGLASAHLSALAPGVPTIASQGLAGFESASMLAMFAPAATPRSIVTQLNREVVAILKRQDIRDKFFGAGIETVASTPEQLGEAMKAEMARLGKVIRDAGIRAE